jgi:RHS repeat-associated protein
MEKDDEVKGKGNHMTTPFRQYDPRIGRWMSQDPLGFIRPNESPYAGFGNNPIYYSDPSGLTPVNGDTDPPNPESGETCDENCPDVPDDALVYKENMAVTSNRIMNTFESYTYMRKGSNMGNAEYEELKANLPTTEPTSGGDWELDIKGTPSGGRTDEWLTVETTTVIYDPHGPVVSMVVSSRTYYCGYYTWVGASTTAIHSRGTSAESSRDGPAVYQSNNYYFDKPVLVDEYCDESNKYDKTILPVETANFVSDAIDFALAPETYGNSIISKGDMSAVTFYTSKINAKVTPNITLSQIASTSSLLMPGTPLGTSVSTVLSVASFALGVYEADKTATAVKSLTSSLIESVAKEMNKKQIGTAYYNLMNY